MFSLIPWKKRDNGGNVSIYRDRGEDLLPLARLRDEFDALWNRFLGDWNRGLSLWDDDFRFGVNSGLEDKGSEYVFHADLPGFEPSDIDVQVSGNTLCVKAECKQEKAEKEGFRYRHGSFQRYVTLPYGVDDQKIDARYHSGVLEIRMPKTEQAKGKRVPVQVN